MEKENNSSEQIQKEVFEGDHWNIDPDLQVVSKATEALGQRLAEEGWSTEAQQDAMVGFDEALVNAIKHGTIEQGKNTPVSVTLSLSPDTLTLVIEDSGSGFDWKNIPDPREGNGLEKASGRGIFLMQQLYDEVSFNEAGNVVTLIKRRS